MYTLHHNYPPDQTIKTYKWSILWKRLYRMIHYIFTRIFNLDIDVFNLKYAGRVSGRDILGKANSGDHSWTCMGSLRITRFLRAFLVCRHLQSALSSNYIDCDSWFLNRFALVNAGILYIYFSSFQEIDEEEFGGAWELTKEGFMTSSAGFLVRSVNS